MVPTERHVQVTERLPFPKTTANKVLHEIAEISQEHGAESLGSPHTNLHHLMIWQTKDTSGPKSAGGEA